MGYPARSAKLPPASPRASFRLLKPLHQRQGLTAPWSGPDLTFFFLFRKVVISWAPGPEDLWGRIVAASYPLKLLPGTALRITSSTWSLVWGTFSLYITHANHLLAAIPAARFSQFGAPSKAVRGRSQPHRVHVNHIKL
jgi:hypothetical protein